MPSSVSGSILVIDPDDVTARLLKIHLERGGFAVALARSGADGLAAARLNPPDLILGEARLPDMSGAQLCQQVLADSRLRPVPFVLMAAQAGGPAHIAALEAGADDYLSKPLDYALLTARVRALIRRAQLKPALNPLTGLPGSLIIEQEIRRLVAPGHDQFAVLYFDLNHFKAYNDVYGFPAGDEALGLLARVITTAVAALGHPADFVGHAGGDDFVAITTPDHCDAIAQRCITDFDHQAPELYTPADRRRGYLTTKDRQGMIKKVPLLSLAIAIVHNQHHPIQHHWEVNELGADLKQFAKTRPGSAYVKDQRRG